MGCRDVTAEERLRRNTYNWRDWNVLGVVKRMLEIDVTRRYEDFKVYDRRKTCNWRDCGGLNVPGDECVVRRMLEIDITRRHEDFVVYDRRKTCNCCE